MQIWIASTHEEEDILLKYLMKLKKEKRTITIIAPRHIHRATKLKIFKNFNLNVILNKNQKIKKIGDYFNSFEY